MTSPKGNAVLVDALASSLMRGGNALQAVPDLLKRVLDEESWREFTTQRGELVTHDRFAEFVTTPPLRGLGADVALVRRIVAEDTKALNLLDRALQAPAHVHIGRSGDVDNVHVRPAGNSKDRALRKLRQDAPELHAEVLAGRVSAHAAMVQAGYRPHTFTVRGDSPEAVAAALRRQLAPDDLARVIALLVGGAA